MMISLLLSTLYAGTPAASFVGSIGVNTHFDQAVGQWQNYSFLEQLLVKLGIRSIRTSGTIYNDGGAHAAFVNKLAADGISSDQLFTSGSTTADVLGVLGSIKSVSHIEGPNERDICCGDSAWVAHDQATTAQLAAARTQYPAVTVIAPSVSMLDPALLGNLTSVAQAANAHLYFGTAKSAFQPEVNGWGGDVYGNGTAYGSVAYNMAAAQRSMPGAPVVATEAGYTTSLVTEAIQATYTERLALVSWLRGIKKLWLYDLCDDAQSFGMCRTDGSLKPVAYGMQGLISNLADSGTFTGTCQLNATITTSVAYQTALLCKSTGEKDLVVWRPDALQDPNTGAATPITPSTAQVVASGTSGKTLIATQTTAYRWGTSTAANRGKFSVSLTERPLVMRFTAQHAVPLLALPVIGTGLINGKPIAPGSAHISSGD
jgi:hypothetical protein